MKEEKQECSCSICESKYIDSKYQRSVLKQSLLLTAAFLLLGVASCHLAHAGTISNKDAINAIIGEGESESYLGKLALAYTIINRGTLKGVYGLHSKRVLSKAYGRSTYNDAFKAWFWALKHPSRGWRATGWGNAKDLKVFKRQGWFGRYMVTEHIGGHWFYREMR